MNLKQITEKIILDFKRGGILALVFVYLPLACLFLAASYWIIDLYFPAVRAFLKTASEAKSTNEITFGILETTVRQSKDAGKPLGTIIAPQLVLGVLGFFGGTVGLWQWNRSYAQKQEEIYQKDRDIENKAAEFTFTDIQRAFASTEPMQRASAALRLAGFARTPRLLDPEEKRVAKFLPATEKDNPYFLPAVIQLTTALHIETNTAVRQNIVEAVSQIARWERLPDDNILRTELIHRIADANRMAKDDFIRAFAAWSVVSKYWMVWEEFDFVTSGMSEEEEADAEAKTFALPVALTLFCTDPKWTTDTLLTLTTEKAPGSDVAKFAVAQRVHRDKRAAISEDEKRIDAALRVPTLETAAQTLIATRNALAAALLTLKPPEDFPPTNFEATLTAVEDATAALKTATTDEERDKARGNLQDTIEALQSAVFPGKPKAWKRFPVLNLSFCFLAGANLNRATLTGARLSRATLTGANLYRATLTGARLSHATLNGANLSRATLTGANLISTTLTGANLNYATLTGANLNNVTLVETDLHGATLTGADLNHAPLTRVNFTRATLTGTNLGGATLTGVRVTNSDIDTAAFIPDDWEQAIFRVRDGIDDTKLKERVRAAYQRQQEERHKQQEE